MRPAWTETLGAIVAEGNVIAIARCRTCKKQRTLDIPALIKKVGPDYSFWNRRCKCRLTPGCDGWNVFGYSTGTWVYHLFDDATDLRWCLEK